jgi:hypothetical protein
MPAIEPNTVKTGTSNLPVNMATMIDISDNPRNMPGRAHNVDQVRIKTDLI